MLTKSPPKPRAIWMATILDADLNERLVAEVTRRRLATPNLPPEERSSRNKDLPTKGVTAVVHDAVRAAEEAGLTPPPLEAPFRPTGRKEGKAVNFAPIERYVDLPQGRLASWIRLALDKYLPPADAPAPVAAADLVLVTLSLPAEDLEWCQREADRLGTTRQEIVAKAALGYLEQPPTAQDLLRLRDTLRAKGADGRKDLARTSAKIPYATHRAIEEIAARRRAAKEPGGEITTVYREAVRLAVEHALGHQLVEAPKPVIPETVAPTQSDEAPIQAAPEDAGGASDTVLNVTVSAEELLAWAEENLEVDAGDHDWSTAEPSEIHPAAPTPEAAMEEGEASWTPEQLLALGLDPEIVREVTPEGGKKGPTEGAGDSAGNGSTAAPDVDKAARPKVRIPAGGRRF
ncbi:hypothetical protein [Roseomonas genomospecies 6]|uniref:Ribbon-helix-helix protein, CopG family n=1 Tax=Roseomonas genomospecies 6 TaxID=214106 RepID=A0A9W7KR95_9PROT|nr:hypothetical protein [Roseomonas genomospecies 6]KAA0677609.1 hypothetical protein DS843_22480 [Roseomonas genomospecies 6]